VTLSYEAWDAHSRIKSVGARVRHFQKNVVRNREIFAARQQGESIEELAEHHGLSNITVCEIIRVERHKIAVSVDAFYQEIRSQEPPPQTNPPERQQAGNQR
jgi:hypothetical protein